ncbi:MAG: glycosyltransferase 87 family protein [Pseudomonadota bacterium]
MSLLALAVLAIALVAITPFIVAAIDRSDIASFVHLNMVQAGLYATAAAIVLFSRPKDRVWLIAVLLLVAILIRLMAMQAPPNLTTDAYRYVWDGRLILEGINPYLYVPADPQLSYLRDDVIYPNINKKDVANTIYPPVAQFLFALGAYISPTILGQKIVMFICDLMVIGCLLAWLHHEGLPLTRIILYAWHPLPIWEFSSQAHIDAAIAALMAAAIVSAAYKRQAITGAIIAAGFMVKYYPALLVPALWRHWDWRLPTAFIVTCLICYAPFITEAGSRVVGFLGNHLGNEGYRDGWGFHVIWLLRDVGFLPIRDDAFARSVTTAYLIASALILMGLALKAYFVRPQHAIKAIDIALLAAAFVWLTSPHYPWYAGFLVIFLVRTPHPALFVMTIGAILLQYPRLPGGLSWTHLYFVAYWLPLILWVLPLLWRRCSGLSNKPSV